MRRNVLFISIVNVKKLENECTGYGGEKRNDFFALHEDDFWLRMKWKFNAYDISCWFLKHDSIMFTGHGTTKHPYSSIDS